MTTKTKKCFKQLSWNFGVLFISTGANSLSIFINLRFYVSELCSFRFEQQNQTNSHSKNPQILRIRVK